jgi:quercetin dioxygenase-like cupin family protein
MKICVVRTRSCKQKSREVEDLKFVASESSSKLHIIEGENGTRSVRLYTEAGLANEDESYTFLVAYIPPFGSNNLHEHTVDEIMYVLSGKGKVRVDESEGALDTGSLIHAPADTLHQIFNDSPETMKLVCLFKPALPNDELSALLGEDVSTTESR